MQRAAMSIALTMFLLAGMAPHAHGEKVRTRKLSNGVTLRQIKRGKARLRIKVVSVSPKVRHRLRPVLASGELPGLERTSSMARRKRAVAAINGDYARRSGRPVMTFAANGKLLQTPLVWGRNFALTRDAERAYIGHPKVKVKLGTASLGNSKISRVNDGPPRKGSLAMFTRAGGRLERPPRRGCSARLLPTGIPKRAASGGLQTRHRVDRVRCGEGRMFPLSGVTVSARGDGTKRHVIDALKVGGTASLTWSLGWEDAYQTLGGNPTLVEGGRVVIGRSKSDPFFRRHPRTGVGIARSGRVFLVTVDGRQKRSRGMTLRGFATFFRHYLGARWALNLDGGGSTTMVVKGRVINRPSDRSERPVSSALVLLPRGYKKMRTAARIATHHEVAGAEVWDEVVSDPASTGGLASSLDSKQTPLGRELHEAARAFDKGRPHR